MKRWPAAPAAVFADFAAIPALLALSGTGPVEGRWAKALRGMPASLDHVEDGPAASARDPFAVMAKDAAALCRAAGLLEADGSPSGDARRILGADSPESALSGLLAARLTDGWRIGPEGVAAVPLLVGGAERMKSSERILGTGLLLCEMAFLVSAARRGRQAADRAVARVEGHRKVAEDEVQAESGKERAESGKKDEGRSRIGERIALADIMRVRCLRDDRADSGRSGVMGLTMARSTAMLLTFSGLFDEAVPLGPTNCLALPMEGRRERPSPLGRSPVLTVGGALWNPDPDIDGEEAARLMGALLEHNAKKTHHWVHRRLGVDRQARRAAGTERPKADEDKSDLKEWRKINKALAMELLTSEMLARIDGAKAVHAQLSARNGHPYRAAGSGNADIEAEYPDGPDGGPVSLVAETSAKKAPSAGDLREQMEQALRFGRRLQKDRGGVVYALAVTDGQIATEPGLRNAFKAFVSEKGLEPRGPVRLLPVYGLDLAGALMALESAAPGQAALMETEAFTRALDGLRDGLMAGGQEDENWMERMLANPPAGDQLPLEAETPDEDEAPSGPSGP